MTDDPKPSAKTELRAAKPIHCVSSDGTVRVLRRTGRPKKIIARPTVDQNEYAERVAEIAERFVAQDELVRAATVQHDRDDDEVFDRALQQLASEQGGLAFERQRMTREGKDCSQVASRRIEALSKMASLILERARTGGVDHLDVHSPRFQKLVTYFMGEMAEAARGTLNADEAEGFLARYRTALEGWEDRVS